MPDDELPVGTVLRRLRRKRRLTQETLARLAKIHSSTLSRIERHRHKADLDTLEALADALGTTGAAILAATHSAAALDVLLNEFEQQQAEAAAS